MMLYVGRPLPLPCLRMLMGTVFAMPVGSATSDGQGWSLTGADSAQSTGVLLPFGSSAIPSEVFGIKYPMRDVFCCPALTSPGDNLFRLARHTRESGKAWPSNPTFTRCQGSRADCQAGRCCCLPLLALSHRGRGGTNIDNEIFGTLAIWEQTPKGFS